MPSRSLNVTVSTRVQTLLFCLSSKQLGSFVVLQGRCDRYFFTVVKLASSEGFGDKFHFGDCYSKFGLAYLDTLRARCITRDSSQRQRKNRVKY